MRTVLHQLHSNDREEAHRKLYARLSTLTASSSLQANTAKDRDIRQREWFCANPSRQESLARPRLNPLSSVINPSTIAQYHRLCTTTPYTYPGYSSSTPLDTESLLSFGDDGFDAQSQHIASAHLASP